MDDKLTMKIAKIMAFKICMHKVFFNKELIVYVEGYFIVT